MVAEHPISIVMDLARDAIELYNVFDYTLLTCYEQEVEFVLSIRDWIVRSKAFSEFCNKRRVTGHPQRTGFGGVGENVGFEPLQGNVGQIGLRECNFGVVRPEGFRMFLEIELTLDKECAEPGGIHQMSPEHGL